MKYIYIVFLSIIITSCSSVDNQSNFDYGTDRGYKDLKVVFDDGTDYYIQDKNVNTKSIKLNLFKKKTTPKAAATAPAATYSTPVKTTTKDKSLKYASAPGNANLLYPIENISIKSGYKQGSFKGLEFKVDSNTDIKSSAPGMVIFSGNKASLGNTIFVYHNNGYITIYSNLENVKYKKGDFIKSSDKTIGTASNSFKFELRQRTDKGVVAVDPTNLLKKR